MMKNGWKICWAKMHIIVQTCLNHQQAVHFPNEVDYRPFGNTNSHTTNILLCLQYPDRKKRSIFPNVDIVVKDFLQFETKFVGPRKLIDEKIGLYLEIPHRIQVHALIFWRIKKTSLFEIVLIPTGFFEFIPGINCSCG